MSNSSSSSSPSGIGCGGLLAVLLTVAFVVLKLTGVIAWSWLWVISPALIYVGLCILFIVGFLGIVILGALGVGAVQDIQKSRAKKKREALLEARRLANARPLGTFDSVGEKVKEHQPHQWML